MDSIKHLISLLKQRRSRRFGLGMEIKDGALKYKSNSAPSPLTAEEEALLIFTANGLTGFPVADFDLSAGQGANIMGGMHGRTIPSGDAIQATALFLVNDNGAYFFKRPQELSSDLVDELLRDLAGNRFQEMAEKTRIQIKAERVAPPCVPLFNIAVNRWWYGASGSSYFLPVNDVTFLYINGLLEILNEHTGAYILDERANFQPAGLKRFAKSRGGHLRDDPTDGCVATVALVERLVTEFVTVEQGMMHQNLALMTEALGLGGFPNFANHEFGWFEALGFRMGSMGSGKYFGANPLVRFALKALKQETQVSYPLGLEHDGKVLLKCYSPPYFPSMEAAVRAVVDYKFGAKGIFRRDQKYSWKENFGKSLGPVSEKAIQATIAYCDYVWKRYGRFPALLPAFHTVVGFQVTRLDPEFYEKFYGAGILPENARGLKSRSA
jgi:hypothetical protein